MLHSKDSQLQAAKMNSSTSSSKTGVSAAGWREQWGSTDFVRKLRLGAGQKLRGIRFIVMVT